VWFTLTHGIVNEVFFPRIDQACIRDMGFIVTDGRQFFSEEKRPATSAVSCFADGVPAFRLINTCRQVGKMLRIETLAPGVVHWSTNDWRAACDLNTREVGLGIYIVDLPTEALPEPTPIRFKFYWPQVERWEGADFLVCVDPEFCTQSASRDLHPSRACSY